MSTTAHAKALNDNTPLTLHEATKHFMGDAFEHATDSEATKVMTMIKQSFEEGAAWVCSRLHNEYLKPNPDPLLVVIGILEQREASFKPAAKAAPTTRAQNQATHTPAPWSADLGDNTRSSEIWAGDVIVADIHTHVVGDPKGSHADAHLIAVAPELLKELITCRHDLARMLGELRQCVTVPDTDSIPDEDDQALCQFEESRIARLDALIAKAQGAA